MTSSRVKNATMLLLFLSAFLAFACHKKTPAPPPPPPPAQPAPPPAAPTITLRANPGTVNRGQAVTLQWDARNAANVNIEPGVGQVAATGNRQVNPTSSVTYTATATGPGGTATDTARVTVNVPPPPAPPPPAPRPPAVSMDDLFRQNVHEVLFDFDKSDIRPDQVSVVQGNAAFLKQHPELRVTIEGHCDERGNEEYNLGLGDRRANAVKEALAAQGVSTGSLMTISYGKERPVCTEQTEECYQRNRRAAFVMAGGR